ncbi:MAG: 1-deoxy-D-xylulose-5-phosphate synthase N-terminal domain-containing protein [Candidatus Marinarcus sp.]|uniref:1-deoxy-D-xylulose-5-phosphate synthase N-terminal domain-containing protein n=1 Tax=Candidatus Marinarcus sp. TaxID=3100987 RepID=UPI003B00157F
MNRKKLSTKDVRNETIKLSCNSGAGHLAPSLSTIEFMTVLFNEYLTYNTDNPEDEFRDRVVFSKGHGAYAYYVILNKLGFIPDYELETYHNGSSLKGCLVQDKRYMLEASTGSLGHGLPIAAGMAKSFKLQSKKNKVICIVGDGEMQEGSNFEALAFAYRHKLDNLLLIVDANDFQAMDRVGDVALDNDRLSKVLSVYVEEDCFFDIDAHDESILKESFKNFFDDSVKKNSFSICIARTIKGKGLPLIESQAKYHFRCPTEDGYEYSEDENE